jgi:hypothetical protein
MKKREPALMYEDDFFGDTHSILIELCSQQFRDPQAKIWVYLVHEFDRDAVSDAQDCLKIGLCSEET